MLKRAKGFTLSGIFKIKSRPAFTLAEVLIVLGIIGLIAEMTIPDLINDYQKTLYTVALKKSYNTFNQALTNMASNQGCTGDLKCTGFFDFTVSQKAFGDELIKYLKVAKNCSTSTTEKDCFSNKIYINYNGTGGWTNAPSTNVYYRFITMDGVAYSIYQYGNNCSDLGASRNVTGHLVQDCGTVYIDVNGPVKGPNYFGRDVFYFLISNGKGAQLYPIGGVDYINWWKDPANGNPKYCYSGYMEGEYCAGRVIEEGWEMNY